MKNVLFIAVISMLMIACKPKGDYKAFTSDPILYSKTVKKLNNIVVENNFPPMIGARNYVYANIAAFECVAAGDLTYQSVSGQIKHMPVMPRPDTSKRIDFSLAALLSFTKVGNAATFPEIGSPLQILLIPMVHNKAIF